MTYKRHQQYQPLCLHSLAHITHASPDMSESESNSLAFNSDLVPKKRELQEFRPPTKHIALQNIHEYCSC